MKNLPVIKILICFFFIPLLFSCKIKKTAIAISNVYSKVQLDSTVEQLKQDNEKKNVLNISEIPAEEVVEVNPDTILFASISKSSCYGNCPIFKILCFESGYIIYEGIANVELTGKFETRIDSSYKSEFRKKIHEFGFLNLENKYPANNTEIIDFPITVCGFYADGSHKIVQNRNDAPVNLILYERFFTDFFNNAEWRPKQN
jgi:hypothetical protein